MQIPNEILWIGFLILDLILVVVVFRYFGKYGLVAYMIMAVIACNIQVVKLVDLFGWLFTLGNVLYGSLFFCTDLISEVYGKEEAKKFVWLGFVSFILMTLFMQIALMFTPAEFDEMHPHLKALFSLMPRVAVASLLAYLLSQFHDIWAFHRLKDMTQGRMLWLRNNLSTFVSQGIDSSVFVFIAFGDLPFLGFGTGIDSWGLVFEIWLTTYLIKLVVAVFDTPFIYWGRMIAKRIEPAAG